MPAADEPDFEQYFDDDKFHEFDGGGGGNSEANKTKTAKQLGHRSLLRSLLDRRPRSCQPTGRIM